jgi:hypothetical protein
MTNDNEYHFPPVDRILTEIEVFRIAGELRNDRGTPEQALALMTQFVEEGYSADGPSRELVTFVRDALADYLAGKSLEAAFRLVRGRRGRSPVDWRARVALAKDMLKRRVIDGLTFDEAALATASALHSNRTEVCKAFKQYRNEAFQELCEGAAPEVDTSVPLQHQRLGDIFPWFR